MSRTRLSKPARADLIDIWGYVAADNPGAADRLVDSILRRCSLLARMPRAGRLRPELVPGIRSYPVGRYLIFYREAPGGIAVARILSGERDLRRILRIH